MFDVAVVGGGVTGAMVAYFCQQAGLKVILYEKDAIAANASGAAGAFISPRIGKGGPLQQLTNEAFNYAIEFYKHNFPYCFTQTGVYRIAKDNSDAKNFPTYQKHLQIPHTQKNYRQDAAFFFPQAGVVDAQRLCEALVEDVTVIYKKIDLHSIEAKNVVLATGAADPMVDLEYIGLRKTWGIRIDALTKGVIQNSLHKDISISATDSGVVRIGATHEKDPVDKKQLVQKGITHLIDAAKELTGIEDIAYKRYYEGTRSAVRDYFPIAGKVVDSAKTLQQCAMVKKGIIPRNGIYYHKDLYMVGGTGGRGFVFAPFLADQLSQQIIKGVEVDKRVDPDRLFYKWARKLK